MSTVTAPTRSPQAQPQPAAAQAPATGGAPASARSPEWIAPVLVDPVASESSVEGRLSLLVALDARPNMRPVEKMPRGAERKQAAWQLLNATAAQSQQPFVAMAERLRNEGAITGYETLVSPNMLVLHTPGRRERDAVAEQFKVEGVKGIYLDKGARIWPGRSEDAGHGAALVQEPWWGLDVDPRSAEAASSPTTAPWGLNMVGAQEAWAQGATGAGLVFGSIDTGADVHHEALRNSYRGAAGDGTLDHDYNWMDWRGADEPVDTSGHGTHTIGTAVGTAPDAPIGVAPGATWISARGLTGGADTRMKAMQWMQAPTRRDGSDPDPTKAPDVVGMSWWTGPKHGDLFEDVIRNLRSAGIEVVKSGGNTGPDPETISSPGQFKEIHTIAAVDKDGEIAEWSARGPSPLPHTGRGAMWKPDYSAPGVKVLSSVPGNRYAELSGTSMAQPHFSGALLSILSKYPELKSHELDRVLAESSIDVGARGRDLEFGHGIVHLPSALKAAERVLGERRPPRESGDAAGAAPTPAHVQAPASAGEDLVPSMRDGYSQL